MRNKIIFFHLAIVIILSTSYHNSFNFYPHLTTSPTSLKIIVLDNESKIQDAIDVSHDGDTIILNPGIYYEAIHINKSLSLIGTNKNKCVLYSSDYSTINIDYQNIRISNITIINNNTDAARTNSIIISPFSHNLTIDNCIVNTGGYLGIYAWNSGENTLTGLNISNCFLSNCGVSLKRINNSTIEFLTIINSPYSLQVILGDNITISHNNLSAWNTGGLQVTSSKNCIISHNNISNKNGVGISVDKEVYYNLSCENIEIFNNKLNNCKYGGYLENVKNVSFIENEINNFSIAAFYLLDVCSYTLINNTIYNNNSDYCITIQYRTITIVGEFHNVVSVYGSITGKGINEPITFEIRSDLYKKCSFILLESLTKHENRTIYYNEYNISITNERTQYRTVYISERNSSFIFYIEGNVNQQGTDNLNGYFLIVPLIIIFMVIITIKVKITKQKNE